MVAGGTSLTWRVAGGPRGGEAKRGGRARAEGEERGRPRLGVTALVSRHDAIVRLRGVEVGSKLLELAAEFAGHGVPPRDVGRGPHRRGQGEGRKGGDDLQEAQC